MAAPKKQGLDYFPLDVQIDNKLKFIKAKFGWEGYGIIIGLFQHIYGHSYWCPWGGDDCFLYSSENNINKTLLIEIIDEALKRGLFSKELYEKHQILTSSGIQKRYAEIVKRRIKVEIKPEYVLIGNALCKHIANILPTQCAQDDDNFRQTETETETETEEEAPRAKNPTVSKSTRLKSVASDMREKLAMNDQQITSVWNNCSDEARLKEAVQCAVEHDADLRKEGTCLNHPVAKIKKAYDTRQQSRKTRFEKGDNQPPLRAEKKERSLAELKAAAIYHKDGTIELRD